jgi:Calx-beta domain/Carboxypeptidase regulatory-like domain
MSRIHGYRTTSLVILATLLSVGLSFVFLASAHSQYGRDLSIRYVTNSFAENDIVRSLPLPANDVIYNEADGSLYISSPSSAGSIGNSVSIIDPITGHISRSIFVGSEPNKLALSSNGQTMYVGLDGASAIRKIDLATQTAGFEFSLGYDNFSTHYSARDIAVMPGNANKLAVARSNVYGVPGVAVYDNGFRLPLVGPEASDTIFLAFASPSLLYGGGGHSGLRTMSVNDSGVVETGLNNQFRVGRIRFLNGLVYTSLGLVFQPQTHSVVGTFPNAGQDYASNAFAIDPDTGRAIFAVRESSSIVIKAYDTATYVLVGTLTIAGLNSNPIALVRYRGNGLALSTSDGRLHLIQTSLIPTSDPLPTPSPSPAITPTPSPTAHPASVYQADILINDVVFNATTGRLLASIPSSAGSNGNSIGTIEPFTAQLESTSYIGSEPNKIALANDGNVLWVGLDGAGSVRRFDISTRQPSTQFSLGTTPSGMALARDIAIPPGSSDTVAVSSVGIGVGLFDDGTPRGPTVNSGGLIDFVSPDELVVAWGTMMSRYGVGPMGFSSRGAVAASDISDFQASGDNRVYFVNGRVVDVAADRVIGTFNVGGQPYAMALDQANGRIFYVAYSFGTTFIRAFDLNTFRPLGQINIQPPITAPTSLVRWGSDGLALRGGDGRLQIIRSTLVNPDASVPAPTPSISPTPTATPTPGAATFVREIRLPTGDFVWNPRTNLLHVSVSGIAGPGLGNSIVGVDPISGEVRNATFIGSEPGKIAMSSDGGTLYCKLDGSGNSVRRFDLLANASGLQFNGPQGQIDMRVMPNNPQTVAFVSSVNFGEVSVWDNGIKRGNLNANVYGVYSIDFLDDATIYGCSSSPNCGEFQVSQSGVIPPSILKNWGIGFMYIKAVDGLVFGSAGRVYSKEIGAVIGSFPGASGPMAVDRPANKVYFYSPGQITAFDLRTFLKIGSISVPINGEVTRLERWGQSGLAIRTVSQTRNQFYLIQSALISATEPIPTGLQIAAEAYSYSEGISTIPVPIVRTGDLSSTVTVDYATTDGTASAGIDYQPASGTVTFLPGESSKNVDIQIINDNLFESPETFVVTLGRPTGSNVFVVPPQSTTISIFDNDLRPIISGSNRLVSEYVSTVLVPVSLSNPSTETITVSFTTANGSAQAGSDFVATSGTLTFAPLEVSKNVPVTILRDSITEVNETFSLLLSAPVNANIGSGTVQITIVDSPGFTLSGRVTTPNGQNLRNATVTLIDSNGARLTATTSSFGLYQFPGVLPNQSVVIAVVSRRYRFTPRTVLVTADIANLDFVGLE